MVVYYSYTMILFANKFLLLSRQVLYASCLDYMNVIQLTSMCDVILGQ